MGVGTGNWAERGGGGTIKGLEKRVVRKEDEWVVRKGIGVEIRR